MKSKNSLQRGRFFCFFFNFLDHEVIPYDSKNSALCAVCKQHIDLERDNDQVQFIDCVKVLIDE